MKLTALAGMILVVAIASDCGDGLSPVAPTPTGGPTPALQLSGHVTDTFQRPIAGAQVEIVAGTGVGLSTLTTDDGAFLFQLPSRAATVTLRITKEGFKDATINVADASSDLRISMTRLGASALNGSYVVTITADSVCTQIPEAFRTRTYNATIGRESDFVFSVALSGAELVTNSDVFWGNQSGNDVHFFLTSLYAMNTWLDELPIVERVGQDEYVAVDGRTSIVSVMGSPVDTTFEGSISYCSAGERSAPFYRCASLCTSNRHRLTLTPTH